MWNRYLILLLFLFFHVPFLLSQETVDSENPIITWDPIPKAIGYQLQIRNEEEEIILSEELAETSYALNLDPGKYSHRVGAYNKFKKISSYSEWFPFIISRSLAPEVTNEKKIISSKKFPEKTILIKGKGFYKSTLISLKNKNATLSISKMKLVDGVFELTIDNKSSNAGNYDLIMENPRKKVLVIKNYYILEPDGFFSFNANGSYPYWKEAGMSAILPGWGQIRKKQFFSAVFLDLALLASAGFYQSTLNTFSLKRNKYNETVINGILYQEIKLPNGGIYGLFSSENQFHQAEASANYARQASILLASIYFINILDALLWKTSIKVTKENSSIQFYANIKSNSPNYANSNSNRIEFGLNIQF